MTTTQRVVKKSLIGDEDLTLGEGTEVQSRNGADYTITQIRRIQPVNSLAELNALDTDKYIKAALFDDSVLTFYYWDGASWLIAADEDLQDLVTINNITALRAYEPLYDGQEVVLQSHAADWETASTTPEGGGHFVYVSADISTVDDNGLVIVTPGGARWKRRISTYVTPEMYGAIAYDVTFTEWPDSSYIDSTVAINSAHDSALSVEYAKGTYRASDELLCFTAGQKITGQGGGALQLNFFARKQNVSWQTRILFEGTPTKYVKTRRLPRLSALDPEDPPTAVGFNIENDYVTIKGIFVDLAVNYADTSPTNLGADFDVGIFSGTRIGTNISDCPVRGYFRQAAILIDNTRLNDAALQFSTPGGLMYPAGDGVLNGTDKTRGDKLITGGGLKGLFIAGPIDGDNVSYYDEIAGSLVADSRGGFGTSDTLFTQCFFGGPDHHSGYRRYDPPLNDAMDRIDPSKVDIDEASGSYFYDSRPAATASRRVKFETCRFVTIESIRIFIGNGREMIFDNPVTESLSGEVRDTTGTIIDQFDYVLQSFKDIAVYATDYDGAGSGAERVSFLQSGGTPNPNYFQNLVPEHYLTIVGNDPAALDYTESTGAWLNATSTTNASSLSRASFNDTFFLVSLYLDYSALDTADVSSATIAVTLGQELKAGDSGTLYVDKALSTGIISVAADIIELRAEGISSVNTRFELFKNGVVQQYDSGTLNAAGIIIANGVTVESPV